MCYICIRYYTHVNTYPDAEPMYSRLVLYFPIHGFVQMINTVLILGWVEWILTLQSVPFDTSSI